MKTKIISILILLSLGLTFSLFTNQAGATTMIGTTSHTAVSVGEFTSSGPSYLETRYVTSVTGTLQQVNLAILGLSIPLGNPLYVNSDFLNYTCWANGVNLTGADSITWDYIESYGWGSYDYGVLTWNCSQAIAGAPLVFEFRHSAVNISYRYSLQSGAPETADLNGDGNYSHYKHNTPANFGDGVVNGYTGPGRHEVGLSFVMGGTYTPPAPPAVPPSYTTQTFGTIGWLPNEASYKRTLAPSMHIMEHGNYIKQTGIIRQVDLGVWSTELIGAAKNLDATDFGDLWLYVDDEGPYHPTNITWPEIYLDSNGYERAIGILTWYGLNITVSNEYTIFELRQTLPQGLIYRTSPTDTNGNGLADYDLDGDGLYSLWEGTGAGGWQNGIADGLNSYNLDPAFRFMIDVPDAGTGGLDSIGQGLDIQPSVIKTKTSMFINYAVSSLANDLHIDVYDGSANVTDQGCPYTIPVYYGTFVYNPQTAGAYIIYLSNATDVVQSKVSVTVSANTEADWVQAIPPMGSFINPVRLNYKYSKDADGVIGIFDSMDDTTALSNAIDTIGGITAAGTYNMTVMPLNTAYSENKIYYRLFTNSSEPVSGVGTFVIYTVVENKLTPQYSPLTVESEVFYYAHNFVNAKVGVFVDGIKIQDVGDRKSGSFSYAFQTNGFKQVDMRVYLGGVWIPITNFTLNVTASSVPDVPVSDGGWWDVSGFLGPLWSSVLGLILVIVCVMIPTIIDTKYKLNLKVPQLAYVMLGCVGIALSIVLGLWPLWIIAFLLIIIVLAGVFVYVLKPGATE